MLGQFGDRQRVRLLAPALTEGMATADVDRGSASKVGKDGLQPKLDRRILPICSMLIVSALVM